LVTIENEVVYSLSNDIKIDDRAWPWNLPFRSKLSKFSLSSSISRNWLQVGPQLLRLAPWSRPRGI